MTTQASRMMTEDRVWNWHSTFSQKSMGKSWQGAVTASDGASALASLWLTTKVTCIGTHGDVEK